MPSCPFIVLMDGARAWLKTQAPHSKESPPPTHLPTSANSVDDSVQGFQREMGTFPELISPASNPDPVKSLWAPRTIESQRDEQGLHFLKKQWLDRMPVTCLDSVFWIMFNQPAMAGQTSDPGYSGGRPRRYLVRPGLKRTTLAMWLDRKLP